MKKIEDGKVYRYLDNPYLMFDYQDNTRVSYTINHIRVTYDFLTDTIKELETIPVYNGTYVVSSNHKSLYLRDILTAYTETDYSVLIPRDSGTSINFADTAYFQVVTKSDNNIEASYKFTFTNQKELYINRDTDNLTDIIGYNHKLSKGTQGVEMFHNEPIFIKFGDIPTGTVVNITFGGEHRIHYKPAPFGILKLMFTENLFVGGDGSGNVVLTVTYPAVGEEEPVNIRHTFKVHCNYNGTFLYFTNQYGGIDVLPVNASSYKGVNVVRNSFINDNRTVNYSNLITDKYIVKTNRMRDSDYGLMRSLVTSSNLYMTKKGVISMGSNLLQGSELIPVTLNTDSIEEKTFRKNKAFLYTFELEECNKKTF